MAKEEIIKTPKEIIKIYEKGVKKEDAKIKNSLGAFRKGVAKESPAERMLNFAKCYDGFFSLDAADLMFLAEEPLDVDIDTYMKKAKLNAADCLDKEVSAKEVKKAFEKLQAEYLDAAEKEKSDIDRGLKTLLKSVEEFRKANRIEVGEESAEEKGSTSSIGQLDL